ncbi:MAG: DUF3786 domain-containing protein [Pseudomonadota bacterium]
MDTPREQRDLFRWAEDLPSALWEDVRARPAQEAAQAVGGRWQEGLFRVSLLGREHVLDPAAGRIWLAAQPGERLGFQDGVVLLTTLAHSLGVPPSGRMVTPLELPGGGLFFSGAHALATGPLARSFAERPEALEARAVAMGSEPTEGADLALKLPGLPQVPLYALFWAGDDELEARAVIGIDDRAHFHLDLGGILALTNLLVRRLIRD